MFHLRLLAWEEGEAMTKDKAWESFIHDYALKMFGNAYVFDDGSRESGLTTHGEDMKASWDACLEYKESRCHECGAYLIDNCVKVWRTTMLPQVLPD
jgi:hypothetical protein